MVLLVLVAFLFGCGYTQGTPYRFDGHKVLQISPKSTRELDMIFSLQNVYDIDVWRHPRINNHTFEVYVKPQQLDNFLGELSTMGVDARVWIDDIQRLIDMSSHRRDISWGRGRQGRYFDLQVYHTFQQIMDYLQAVKNDVYNNAQLNIQATLQTIGYSVENRTIQLLKLSRPDQHVRKGIFIDGAMHAREWISPATVIYFIHQLVYKSDLYTDLLDKFDWYFVPMVNPDGYEHSRTNYRMWRKNRRTFKQGKCIGVDLNRNFGHMWDPSVGGSTNKCSDVFAGTGPFSEPESKALQTFILANNANMLAYLTFHAYGQMWLHPWGYTSALPEDAAELVEVGTAAINALRRRYNTDYVVGSSTNVLYAAAGGSDDWAKGIANIKYAYTPELRDKGAYGFLLPASQIQPTCEETWDAVQAMARKIIERHNL